MNKHEDVKTVLDIANFSIIWAWFVGIIPTISGVLLPILSLIWLLMRMYQTYLEIKKQKEK